MENDFNVWNNVVVYIELATVDVYDDSTQEMKSQLARALPLHYTCQKIKIRIFFYFLNLSSQQCFFYMFKCKIYLISHSSNNLQDQNTRFF